MDVAQGLWLPRLKIGVFQLSEPWFLQPGTFSIITLALPTSKYYLIIRKTKRRTKLYFGNISAHDSLKSLLEK